MKSKIHELPKINIYTMSKKLFLSLCTVCLLFSCEKEDIRLNEKLQIDSNEFNDENLVVKSIGGCSSCVDNDTVTYYLNGEEVEPGTYDPYDSTLYVIVEGDSVNASIDFINQSMILLLL